MTKLDIFPILVAILLFLSGISALVALVRAWLTLFQRGILFGLGLSLLAEGFALGLVRDFYVLYGLIIALPLGCVVGLALSANQAVVLGEYDRQIRLAENYKRRGDTDKARAHARQAQQYQQALGRLRRFRPDQ